MRPVVLATVVLFAMQPAGAKLGAQSVAAFDSIAARAAAASARFADRRVAVADGYRRVGTDFPGMGEHWLNPDLLMHGSIDATRPSLLIYATVNGAPALLGVGFVAVTRGDSAPVSLPGWPTNWHEHSGLLSDESGGGAARHEMARPTTHVWVSHVWTMLANPDGRYTPDNWALPFARAGLRAPPGVDADAGRALSLAVGGDDYLRAVLADAGLRSGRDSEGVDSAIAAARRRAEAVIRSARGAGDVSESDVVALRRSWQSLRGELRAALGPEVETVLAPAHAHHAMPHDPTDRP
ncbi:MAG TPA: hypothetical protein VLN49_10740 [Gemmatimonadaceae bacterium]|nr:hypothetical protein [Gemmatimonadaceae bacterium]